MSLLIHILAHYEAISVSLLLVSITVIIYNV